jgi:hypothetical protein
VCGGACAASVPAGRNFAGLLQGEVPQHDDTVLSDGDDLLLEELERADTRQRNLLGQRDRVEVCARTMKEIHQI